MIASEKVEAGIRCCLGPVERCDECPYREKLETLTLEMFTNDECRQALLREAIAAIEGLKQRVKYFSDKAKGVTGHDPGREAESRP